MSCPGPAGADPAVGIRRAGSWAVLIALASAVVAVLAATGVLVAGCAHGCTAGQLVGEIGIAVLTFAAVGALAGSGSPPRCAAGGGWGGGCSA